MKSPKFGISTPYQIKSPKGNLSISKGAYLNIIRRKKMI